MKFDLSQWYQVPMGQLMPHDTGRLRVQTTRPAALILTQVDAQGEVRRACAGFGTSFDITVEGGFDFELDGPKDCQAFSMEPASVYVDKSSVVFTNMDGVPASDGHYGAMKALARQLRLENSMAIHKLRAEMSRPATQPEVEASDPAVQSSVELPPEPDQAEGQGGADASPA